MTIDDYAQWAAAAAKLAGAPNNEKLAYLGLGLAGEAGEVAERIKKRLRDGRLDKDGLVEELGDVIYYWACPCVAAGRSPSDQLTQSRAKIDARIAAASRAPHGRRPRMASRLALNAPRAERRRGPGARPRGRRGSGCVSSR